MRLNDNTFIGINPPYQLLVIHSSKLIYPREIYQLGEEIYCEALRHIVEAWEGRPDSLQQVGDLSVPEYLTRWLRESAILFIGQDLDHPQFDTFRKSSTDPEEYENMTEMQDRCAVRSKVDPVCREDHRRGQKPCHW